MTLANALAWISIPFVLSTIYFGVRKGENIYYESEKYDGNAALTKGIVIFGATGDLCKRKLIPALHKLWEKKLLPDNFQITGTAGEILVEKSGLNL